MITTRIEQQFHLFSISSSFPVPLTAVNRGHRGIRLPGKTITIARSALRHVSAHNCRVKSAKKHDRGME